MNLTTAVERHPRPRISVPFGVIEPLFALVDVLIIVAAGALGGVLYHDALNDSIGDAGVYAGLGLVASLAYVLAAHCLGLYRLNELLEREHDNGRVWTSWSLAILVLAVILFLFKSGAEASRGSIVCLFVLGGIGLVLSRRMAKRRLRAALMAGAIRGRRAIVIGTTKRIGSIRATRSAGQVRPRRSRARRVVAQRGGECRLRTAEGAHRSGTETCAGSLGRGDHSRAVVVAPGGYRTAARPVEGGPASGSPAARSRGVDRFASSDLDAAAIVYGRVATHAADALERLSKRLLDVTVAATSLVLLIPLLVLAAVAIKLESRGPVIFRQRRHGFNGQSFAIYKLRSHEGAGRRRRGGAGHGKRSARHRAWGVFSAPPASMSCRNC